MAAGLLHYILSRGQDLGIYGIVSASLQETFSPQSPTGGDFNDQAHSVDAGAIDALVGDLPHTLLHGLLSVALELRHLSLSSSVQQSAALNKDSLRASCLARMPQLSWRYQAEPSDALMLLLFSCTWCFTPHLIDVSVRWNNLARVIITDAIHSDIHSAGNNVRAQERMVLALLLHGRQPLPSRLNPGQFPGGLSAAAEKPSPQTYLETLTALTRAIDLVLQAPQRGSRAWREAYDGLENFYIAFPPSLLRFSDLKFLYQAEAMIWMHGLFIVLPSLQRMDIYLESLSSATILFLLLSCAVHVAVLAGYASVPETGGMMLFVESDGSQVPEKLSNSTWVHLQVLSTIRERCARYDSPLLREMERLIASCYRRIVLGYGQGEVVSAEVLMLHRWKGQGTGILPVASTAALAEWTFPQSPTADIQRFLARHDDETEALVDEVCSPTSRICEAGYFDLTIIIRD
ncbi:hypothetical protein ACJ41O_015038 [Fusarium nematophilum]